LLNNPLLKGAKDITNSLKNVAKEGEHIVSHLGNDAFKLGERIASGLSGEAGKVRVKLYH
jgi:hypothetical protein